MSDISVRIEGRAGRITLQRPKALNAMTYDMCTAIEAAFDDWRDDPAVALIVIDAQGDRAFCSGGDIAELYATGTRGDYAYGRKFWADEYRLNHKIFTYPKPVVSFLQGYTMGGGVGIGCHGSHRIVGETSQIAMPECGIGLVPDVGGSFLLAQAPGHLGEYLGTTAARMNASDAIYAGFADSYIPQLKWPDLIATLVESGEADTITPFIASPEGGPIEAIRSLIDAHFAGEALDDIMSGLDAADGGFGKDTLKLMRRNSPLSMACTIEMIHRLRGPSLTMEKALELEYRYTYRAMEHGDFLEGIRAAIIDKDRNPNWQHAGRGVPPEDIVKMLQPLGKDALKLEGTT